jgi:arginine:pyruvate transaminase
MRFSELTDRIAGKSVDTWNVHNRAVRRLEAGEDIFLMSIGQETDSFSPQGVMDAAIDSIQSGRHHYTAVEGDSRLRGVIASRHSQKCGVPVDPDCVVVFCGAQNALFATAQVLLQAGDEVILIEPYYTTYPATVTASGASLVSVTLSPEEEFQLDVDRVIGAITARTKAILVNSPNNPTGAVYPQASLQALIDVCRERDIWLISDEVYMDVVVDPVPCSPFGLKGAGSVVVSVSSVSKSHRMTGWRVGWAIGPKEIARHYYNLNMCMNYGLNGISQDGALQALKHEYRVTEEVQQRLVSQRQVVIDGLSAASEVELYSAGGGMFVILNIRNLDIDSINFAAGLLDRENVSLQPLTGFGASCEGLLRISTVLKEERLQEACRRITRYVQSLK